MGLATYPYQGELSEIHRGFAADLRTEMRARGISTSGMGYGHMLLSVEAKRAREARQIARRIRRGYPKRFPDREAEIESVRIYRWNGKAS